MPDRCAFNFFTSRLRFFIKFLASVVKEISHYDLQLQIATWYCKKTGNDLTQLFDY